MNLGSEIIKDIIKNTNVTYTEIAEVLGMKEQSLRNKISRGSEFSFDDICKVVTLFGNDGKIQILGKSIHTDEDAASITICVGRRDSETHKRYSHFDTYTLMI